MADGYLDPFTRPAVVVPIGDLGPRTHVAVKGTVARTEVVSLPSGPILEVDLRDDTDAVALVFLGRSGIAGIDIATRLVAAGTVRRRRGVTSLLNPYYWLEPQEGRH